MLWTLAKKDLRLLVRDPRAMVVLLAMPVIFIMVLGISLGEGFGQKPDDRLRMSIVILDEGHGDSTDPDVPKMKWSEIIERDLSLTAGIRVEVIPTLEEAQKLVDNSQRAAVLVLGPEFSAKMTASSFMPGGVNPLFRDGINIEALDARLITDPTQLTAAAINEQVAQVTMLRVVLPWMIGRAFDRIGRTMGPMAAMLKSLFPSYDLTGKTWAALTKSEPVADSDTAEAPITPPAGTGLLSRGAQRYQILVPSYMVMFAYFLVLTAGWLFVAERRQGTLKRLRAAPLSRGQILLGKLIPCFLMSFGQGVFLLVAGKLIFGLRWGSEPGWLLLVVLATAISATGLALVVASIAKTEAQVAVYGTLLVLTLAGLSGCLMGDRDLMPEAMQRISLITPHAWALTAYKQLLASAAAPNLHLVGQACLALTGFGVAFIALAWGLLKLDPQT